MTTRVGTETSARPVAQAPAGASVDAIRTRGASKTYDGRTALGDVDLVVPTGSVHGLLGPNGAGKTTLLRMLLGLVRPDHGSVSVLGRTPYGAPGALPGVAGFVDAPRFYPYLSAAKNLDLLAALDGRGSSARQVDALLDRVGLGGRAGEKVRGFSTGMRQRLGLAAVLLREPELMILDEPTSGLDPAGVAEVHDVIRDSAASGRTVLLSSHDMAEVEELCDSVSILREGRLVHQGTIQALREQADAPEHLLATSDDTRAAERAEAAGVRVIARGPDGLVLRIAQDDLDLLVLDLGAAGLPVRALSRRDTALNALFLRLTGDADD